MNNTDLSRLSHQRGVTLVMVLIFLTILTLLGVTVANNNSLQTRMAGGTRQRDLAFQAAEHALKAAEAALNNLTSNENIYIQNFISVNGGNTTATKPDHLLLNGQNHNNDAYYWKNTFNWNTTDSVAVIGISSDLINSNPRYTIEQMPSATCPDDVSKVCFYFRVTAHGVGKDSTAEVVLQSMYKFKG
jgi:type IV pilus assembly protein PilX